MRCVCGENYLPIDFRLYEKSRLKIIQTAFFCFKWSERQDLNLRPLPPQGSTLPSCATSRLFQREMFFAWQLRYQTSRKTILNCFARQSATSRFKKDIKLSTTQLGSLRSQVPPFLILNQKRSPCHVLMNFRYKKSG